jgi:hypothetical protein
LPANIELRDLAIARTIDHALATSGLGGTCATLGEAPGTERLEGPEGGLDHRALDCDVVLVAAPEPPRPGGENPARRPDPGAAPAPSDPAPPASVATARSLPATGGGAPVGIVLVLTTAVVLVCSRRSA